MSIPMLLGGHGSEVPGAGGRYRRRRPTHPPGGQGVSAGDALQRGRHHSVGAATSRQRTESLCVAVAPPYPVSDVISDPLVLYFADVILLETSQQGTYMRPILISHESNSVHRDRQFFLECTHAPAELVMSCHQITGGDHLGGYISV